MAARQVGSFSSPGRLHEGGVRHVGDVNGLGCNQVEQRILWIPTLKCWQPAPDLSGVGMAHGHNGIDPDQAWVKVDGLFGQTRALAGIPDPRGAEGQPLRVVPALRLLGEG
jgi:hypothetical protein